MYRIVELLCHALNLHDFNEKKKVKQELTHFGEVKETMKAQYNIWETTLKNACMLPVRGLENDLQIWFRLNWNSKGYITFMILFSNRIF